MLVSSGGDIVVEVVNNDSIAVRWKMDLEFEEKRADGGRSGGVARQCEENIAPYFCEFEDVFG